jgi:hypothetical protein
MSDEMKPSSSCVLMSAGDEDEQQENTKEKAA